MTDSLSCSTPARLRSVKVADLPACEQCKIRPATVYAMGPGAGDWGGRYCQECADALGFTIQEKLAKAAGGYVNRPGGPVEGAPHCPRCGSSELTPTDEAQYYNEFRCDLCRYVFPPRRGSLRAGQADLGATSHQGTRKLGRRDDPATKTASARDMVPEQTLAQIGKMNLMAISGFRWEMDSNGDMLLPISSGYRVRISLDANDTYTVTREMKRGDKIFVKGTQSDVYAEDLGETCYQASSYKSNDWGGHTVGSKAAALPRQRSSRTTPTGVAPSSTTWTARRRNSPFRTSR